MKIIFLDNELNLNVNGNNLREIQIIYKEEDFILINEAFISLRKKYGYDREAATS